MDDDYRVIVAQDYFAEVCPDARPLAAYHGHPLRLPALPDLRPDPQCCAWHRRRRFAG